MPASAQPALRSQPLRLPSDQHLEASVSGHAITRRAQPPIAVQVRHPVLWGRSRCSRPQRVHLHVGENQERKVIALKTDLL